MRERDLNCRKHAIQPALGVAREAFEHLVAVDNADADVELHGALFGWTYRPPSEGEIQILVEGAGAGARVRSQHAEQ